MHITVPLFTLLSGNTRRLKYIIINHTRRFIRFCIVQIPPAFPPQFFMFPSIFQSPHSVGKSSGTHTPLYRCCNSRNMVVKTLTHLCTSSYHCVTPLSGDTHAHKCVIALLLSITHAVSPAFTLFTFLQRSHRSSSCFHLFFSLLPFC